MTPSLIDKLRKKAFAKTKKDVKTRLGESDKLIIQSIESIDQLDKSFNVLAERAREWYDVTFPEAGRIITEHSDFLDFVANTGGKKDAKKAPEKYREKLEKAAEKSMGTEISQKDLAEIQEFSKTIQKIKSERERLSAYLEEVMKKACPNISALVGGLLGARMLSLFGSLERFAEAPSSTIQVIGAEKALFAHLRKKTKPPKHGAIFQYAPIRSAPRKLRGKIARMVAAKLAIAARADYFKGAFIGEKLKQDVDKKIERILAKSK